MMQQSNFFFNCKLYSPGRAPLLYLRASASIVKKDASLIMFWHWRLHKSIKGEVAVIFQSHYDFQFHPIYAFLPVVLKVIVVW